MFQGEPMSRGRILPGIIGAGVDMGKLQYMAGWGVLAATAMAPFLLGAGYDFLVGYRSAGWPPAVDLNGTWLLLWGYWLIAPFAVFPAQIGLALWSVFGVAGLGWLTYRYQNNPALVGLSFPVLYMVGNGQIEGLLAVGLGLALSANFWLAGLGLTILVIKPQVGGLVALAIVWRWGWRGWRVLIVPLIAVILSVLIYGWWFGPWLGRVVGHAGGLSRAGWNVSLFPWSALLVAPLLWRFRRSERAMLVFPALVSPYYAAYSLALPLATIRVGWFGWLIIWLFSLIYVVQSWSVLFVIPAILLWSIRHEII